MCKCAFQIFEIFICNVQYLHICIVQYLQMSSPKMKPFDSRKEETSRFHPLLSLSQIERQNSDLGRGLVHSVFGLGWHTFCWGWWVYLWERWGWGVSGMGWCLSEGVGGLSAIFGIPSANKDTPRTNLLLIASVWSSASLFKTNDSLEWKKYHGNWMCQIRFVKFYVKWGRCQKIPKRWYTRPCRTDCMSETG